MELNLKELPKIDEVEVLKKLSSELEEFEDDKVVLHSNIFSIQETRSRFTLRKVDDKALLQAPLLLLNGISYKTQDKQQQVQCIKKFLSNMVSDFNIDTPSTFIFDKFNTTSEYINMFRAIQLLEKMEFDNIIVEKCDSICLKVVFLNRELKIIANEETLRDIDDKNIIETLHEFLFVRYIIYYPSTHLTRQVRKNGR